MCLSGVCVIRNCAWKVIELKRMVKLFSGIAHSSCSKDTALQTSRKRVVTVSKAFVTPVMLPSMICYVSREGKSLLCEAEQLEAVFCGA